MKTTFILALSVWVPSLAATALQQDQKDEPDKEAFDAAIELHNNRMTEQSLFALEAFMIAYPQSSLVARAHFNVGYIQRELHQDSMAIVTFKGILDKEYNELDSNDLMEPYTLYKHHSSRNLAEVYLEQKNYKEAEKYIELFDEVYPYQHFCGNELTAFAIYKATMYAQVYEGEGDYLKAIHTLIPHVPYTGLASNRDLITLLDKILTRHFTADQLHQEFATALAGMKLKGKKDESATITLFGEKLKFHAGYDADFNEKENTENEFRKMIARTELFEKYLR